ncbi:hypothetical protein [Deinococcus knuensis]|uniref:Uncharacterized protein n=1 Tax=Deinococcus knuensis TaxID=1837380 RepID=A0ABQ2SEX3_9DEIO|nr:hypothetical protein [Deinococcus knuensis]GGS15610.1 hypothetical protein GCM10008961_03810 [Deinococcus knuensis]
MKIAELDRVVMAAKKHQELLNELSKSGEALDELRGALLEGANRLREMIEDDESREEEVAKLDDLIAALEEDSDDLKPEMLEPFRAASWWQK